MRQSIPAIFGRLKTEPLTSAQAEDANAPLRSAQIGESGAIDRRTHLSHLLARIRVYGVPYYEQEIDQIRTVDHLSEPEREIVLEIFRFGYEAAEKERRQDKMWVYQRLLRRLLLHQPLDQPIPLNELSQEIPGEATVEVAEPSVTQESPKREETSPQVTTTSGSRRVLRYALCSIGTAALIWTAFAFRSPTDIRDAVVPVRDNQQAIAHAPAAQEDRFEPVAHAGTLTPPAESAPVAEEASVATAEPATMRNAIFDKVVAASKSSATTKLDAPGQPGKTKSPANSANQATTVDAATGNKRERESAGDSLPIYTTVRQILLRDEPRFGAAAKIMLDRGARLIVLEINSSWLQVRVEKTGAVGFVREEFVVPASAAAPLSASKDQRPS